MPPKRKVLAVVRIQHEGGNVNMAKLGQAVGVYGVNIVALSKEFNEASAKHRGLKVAADVTIYDDKSMELEVKSPATASLLMNAAGVKKGATRPHVEKAGQITEEQLAQIAQTKLPDLNAESLEQAVKIVSGTARSMGIKVVG